MRILIGLNGNAGSGKDTVAAYMARELRKRGYSVNTLAFSEPLKQFCNQVLHIAFGVSDSHFFGSQSEKAKALPGPLGHTSGRRVCQVVGDALKHAHKDTLALYAITKVHKYFDEGADIVIVTDVRYYSESIIVRKEKGVIVSLLRNADTSSDTHQSETEVSDVDPDYLLDNSNMSLQELYREVDNILCDLHLFS